MTYRTALPAALLAALLAAAGGCHFWRQASDTAPPWTVVAREGDHALVEFTFRPYQRSVSNVHLAGTFNDWSAPGAFSQRGRFYPMDYDAANDRWRTRVLLRVGAHEYVYLLDGRLAEPDPKNEVTLPDGRKVSRLVLR